MRPLLEGFFSETRLPVYGVLGNSRGSEAIERVGGLTVPPTLLCYRPPFMVDLGSRLSYAYTVKGLSKQDKFAPPISKTDLKIYTRKPDG